MRKTQVALAALALVASSAALATEVKLSGQIDIGVFSTGKDTNGENGGVFMEQGGLMDHSSITLSATEDLGNGLKAIAVLESGFNANGGVDNGGTQGNTNALFNRQSYVGLSSDSLGTVGLGKQLSPFVLTQAMTNFGVGSFWVNRLVLGGAGTGGTAAGGGNGVNNIGFFVANAVTYTSPSIAGFTVRAMTATKNGTEFNTITPNDPTAGTDNRYSALSVDGNILGAFVSAAWHQRKDAYSGYTVGAVYPVMESLSIMANYTSDKNKVDDITMKSWAVGGKYTLVQGTDVILQYAQNNGDNSDANNLKRRLTNLTLTHALSKRTTLYGTVAQGKQIGSSLGNFGNNFEGKNNTSYGVGIAHSF